MRVTVDTARAIVAEIAVRFQNGDPAHQALTRLQAVVPALVRHAHDEGALPDELRAEIATLIERVGAAVATGNEWLNRTEPELVARLVRQRLRRTYGVVP
jgi:hypothetical protein